MLSKYEVRNHAAGSTVYRDYIHQNTGIPRLGSPTEDVYFLLVEERPRILDLEKDTAIYFKIKRDNYIRKNHITYYEDSVLEAMDDECKWLLYDDDVLIATDKYVYSDVWMKQPITMYGKTSGYNFLIVAYRESKEMDYYLFDLRTEAGKRALETYFGTFLGRNNKYEEFGMNIYTNIIKIAYANSKVNKEDLKKRSPGTQTRTCSLYNYDYFFEGGDLQ